MQIWEEGGPTFPVVEHLFNGSSMGEALGYFKAHMTTDEFLRDCVERGEWNGIKCRTEGFMVQRAHETRRA